MIVRAVFALALLSAVALPAAQSVRRDPGVERERVKQQIDDKRQNLTKLQKEMRDKKATQRQLEKAEKGVLKQVHALDQRVDLARRDARTYQNNLALVETRLRQVTGQLSQLESDLGVQREALRSRVRSMQRRGQLRSMVLLFSSRDPGRLISRWRFLRELASADRRRLELTRQTLAQVEGYKRVYQQTEADLRKRRGDVETGRKRVETERQRREVVLRDIRGKKAKTQGMLKELEASAGQLQDLLGTLHVEADRLARQGLAPKPSSGGFSALRRGIGWPAKGRLLSRFGKHKHPQYNVFVFNRGIEIAASMGSPVMAVARGTVLFADWFEGFGQMLVLDHGGADFTVYGHNSSLKVARGDLVVAGQPVAEVGDSGPSRRPALYFEIRRQSKAVDPLFYLRR